MSSEAQLATSRGGTGANLTPTNVGDTIQVVAGSVFALAATPVPPSLRVISFYRF